MLHGTKSRMTLSVKACPHVIARDAKSAASRAQTRGAVACGEARGVPDAHTPFYIYISFAEEALRINERRRKSLVADLAVVGVAGVRRRRRYSDIQPISNWRPQAERELALIPGLFPEYD